MQSRGTRLVQRAGIWYIVWPGNTRGRSTGSRNREEAESALAAFISERSRGGYSATGGLTVRRALDDYEREHINNKVADTVRQLGIKAHLEAYFTDHEVAALGTDDFADYGKWRRAGNGGGEKPRAVKDPTIRRELGMLTAAFNHATRQRRISRDKVPFVDLPQGSVPRDHWLLEEECDIFLRACLPGEGGSWQEAMAQTDRLPRVFGFAATALEAAARLKAIEKLTRFQTDMRGGMINFAPAGHRQTKKRRPIVPISDRLRPVLERFLKQNEGASYVLGTSGSIRTAFRTAVRRAEKALRAMGRPERAEAMKRTIPHTLRHTWATLAARSGVPLWEIAGVLGDSISTVTKNYAHHCPDYLRNAVNFRAPRAPVKETENG